MSQNKTLFYPNKESPRVEPRDMDHALHGTCGVFYPDGSVFESTVYEHGLRSGRYYNKWSMRFGWPMDVTTTGSYEKDKKAGLWATTVEGKGGKPALYEQTFYKPNGKEYGIRIRYDRDTQKPSAVFALRKDKALPLHEGPEIPPEKQKFFKPVIAYLFQMQKSTVLAKSIQETLLQPDLVAEKYRAPEFHPA